MKVTLLLLSAFISFSTFSQTKISGTLKSFDYAFTEKIKADGAESEDWSIAIGKMIRTHPTNFLKTLKKRELDIKRLDALVGNFGYEFVDELEASKIEASKRISALRKASYRSNDKEIKRLSKKCISLLKKF